MKRNIRYILRENFNKLSNLAIESSVIIKKLRRNIQF